MIVIKKYQSLFGFLLIFITIITSQTSFSQVEQDAEISIQSAKEKLIEVISLLEKGLKEDSEIVNLVLKADSARNLIKEANDNYLEGDYEIALQKANNANDQLDNLIEEITELLGFTKKKTRLVFSLVGTILGLLSIGLVFLFFKKIYPWYRRKTLEEYEKLVIIYDEISEEDKK